MKKYRIGVDVGGTKVAYGLFDDTDKLLDRFQHPTPVRADGPAFADLIMEKIREMLSCNQLAEEDLTGIGICMPSYILFDQGYVCMTSAMPNVRDFAMREYMQARLSIPVILDNDGNAAAIAEHRYGAGRGSRHMIYMAVSTGIGSGLILNNEIFRGSYGWAGESGHMLLTPDEGEACGCGNRGCFMSWGSGRFLPRHIRNKAYNREEQTVLDLSGELDGIELLRACREGDPIALEVLDQTAHTITVCVYNIYQLLNVNLFVFGGGLVNFGSILFDRVRREFDRYNHTPEPVEFRFAELKQDFGIIGAAELAKECSAADPA